MGRRGFFAAAAVAAGAVTVAVAPRSSAAPVALGAPADTHRYPGYRGADVDLPSARYMQPRTAPAQQHVLDAVAAPPLPAAAVPRFDDITRDLAATGTSAVETGYGQGADGVVFVAARTEMPGVTAAMWDWWFGWHSTEAARYKLWHPDAHQYASLATDLTGTSLPDKQKYIGNTTYVDEYVGPKLQQLGINFRDPVAHGFTVPADQTIIFGRVGSSIAPVDLGWLAHQVRPIDGGAEMRSRFHLNLRGLHVPDLTQAANAIARGASVDPTDLQLGLDLGRDLMLHCGQEMNHLAQFLPELYAEFSS